MARSNSGCVAVIGSGGMLGRELVRAVGTSGRPVHELPGRQALDITDRDAVRRVLDDLRPDIVINAAGHTHVDHAEADPIAAHAANHAGPHHLASVCAELSSLLVHFSSDYVFDGRSPRPYTVHDAPNPINLYGRSKHAGEQAIVGSGCRFLLIRTSRLFAPHGRNFVTTILGLARTRPAIDVVNDQVAQPTYAPDLARLAVALIEREAAGIVHATNTGECSWHELAAAAVEEAAINCEIRPCSTAQMPRPAARPAYSSLDISRTVELVGGARHWRAALRECIERLAPHQPATAPTLPGLRVTHAER